MSRRPEHLTAHSSGQLGAGLVAVRVIEQWSSAVGIRDSARRPQRVSIPAAHLVKVAQCILSILKGAVPSDYRMAYDATGIRPGPSRTR